MPVYCRSRERREPGVHPTGIRLVGKFKASQHRPEAEGCAVDEALEAEGISAANRSEVVRRSCCRSVSSQFTFKCRSNQSSMRFRTSTWCSSW
jgi:hypothetical protein